MIAQYLLGFRRVGRNVGLMPFAFEKLLDSGAGGLIRIDDE